MAEENKARCPESPGPVRNDEQVAFGLWSPEVFNKGKSLINVQALQMDYFLTPKGGHVNQCGDSSGLSVGRVGQSVSRAELYSTIKAICEGKERTVEGSALASVDKIKNIMTGDGKYAFDVLDDGKKTFTTHAVIRGKDGLSKGAMRDPRNQLLDMLNNKLDTSVFEEVVNDSGSGTDDAEK